MAKKILLIDDDLETLKLTGLILKKQGHEILTSTTGETGILLANSQSPDLIILDVMMPDTNGFRIAQKLRANSDTQRTPILMFTAKSQANDRIKGLESGADAYLTKPAKPKEMVAQVKSLLKRFPQQESTPGQAHQKKGNIIGVVSAKGGIGISTLATNLAIKLHQLTTQDILLADFRPGQGTICLDLDAVDHAGLSHLVSDLNGSMQADDIQDALFKHPSGILTLLSAYTPSEIPAPYPARSYMDLAQHFKEIAPFTVLDLGPSWNSITAAVHSACDHILLCYEPSPHNLIQAQTLYLHILEQEVDPENIKLIVINRKRSSIQLTRQQMEDTLNQTIDHYFTPAPELAYQSAQSHTPMVLRAPESMTNAQFEQLAQSILS